MSRPIKSLPAEPSLTAITSAIKKLSLDQKLRLEKKLQATIAADIAALGCPPGVMRADDPNLLTELDRRWRDAQEHPEQCLTLEQLVRNVRRKLRARQKLSQPPSRRGNRKS